MILNYFYKWYVIEKYWYLIGKLYDKLILILLINDLCIDYLCVYVCKIVVCFICMYDIRNGIVLVFLIDRKLILNKM